MRRNLLSGLVLAVAAVLVVVVSATFDLELESVALLGAALGAVLALVPDRSAAERMLGFGLGFAIAWAGYAARAALLPDTSSGRAVSVGLVVVLCTLVAALSAGRLPLWAVLLGTAAFVGGYEFTYNQAPPELMDTSVSTATTLLFTVGIGFLAAALVAPQPQAASGATPGSRRATPADTASDNESGRLDDILESAK